MLKTHKRTRRLMARMLNHPNAIESRKSLYKDEERYLTRPSHLSELNLWNHSLSLQKSKLQALYAEEAYPASGEKKVPAMDMCFMQKTQRIMEIHLADTAFNVGVLSHKMGLSRAYLYRKLKDFTDQSPSEYMRNFRLIRAAALLEHNTGTVSEVAYRTGFNDLSHFSKSFKKAFGVCPSQYQTYAVLRYDGI